MSGEVRSEELLSQLSVCKWEAELLRCVEVKAISGCYFDSSQVDGLTSLSPPSVSKTCLAEEVGGLGTLHPLQTSIQDDSVRTVWGRRHALRAWLVRPAGSAVDFIEISTYPRGTRGLRLGLRLRYLRPGARRLGVAAWARRLGEAVLGSVLGAVE